MRVVGRKTFIALPPGTIYCKGVRWAFSDLCIKGDSLVNDWSYLNPAWPDARDSGEAFDILERGLISGESFQSEKAEGRDGCFDDDDVFLIFENADLTTLRGYIDAALALGQCASAKQED